MLIVYFIFCNKPETLANKKEEKIKNDQSLIIYCTNITITLTQYPYTCIYEMVPWSGFLPGLS